MHRVPGECLPWCLGQKCEFTVRQQVCMVMTVNCEQTCMQFQMSSARRQVSKPVAALLVVLIEQYDVQRIPLHTLAHQYLQD